MAIKRLAFILAREKLGLSKSAVAAATGISAQRYRRIEGNIEVRVDIEEAYKIANFLGYEHPKSIFLSINV
ncbi:helix-turn-helix transcriptional regulator|uniref:Helix-turn-helix n=1 Tax=Dendrosporobacter quercicolus TaxID=146817 RepID=A0A1G9XEN4_9FIRM|nr:helix-turn-helix transcriptional regulator [Dendrosporobacter quercicolus]NSL49687.1 helix-turn-helix transcriptional regulator [Dendrosporobacter quercicolus DSM 1736]SDM95220.1 Helix-turn-helix [Dendrosporobacter quercicolus]